MSELLATIDPTNDLSLYVHVPFCHSKCAYCAFYSLEGVGASEKEAYVQQLVKEVRLVVSRRKAPFTTVFIGGGDPGLLSLDQLTYLVAEITQLGHAIEFTMEVNPLSVRDELKELHQGGLTRLSVGIESLHPQHLNTLGRNATLKQTLAALEIAKQLPFDLNCDLITCIPGQSPTEAVLDIQQLVDLAHPQHISLYNLTMEEGTLLAALASQGELEVPSVEQEETILRHCWDTLQQLGYEQYEVSNFAKAPAHRCLHNLRYWHLNDYIGLGPSAVGTIAIGPQANRFSGRNDVAAYLKEPVFGIYEMENLRTEVCMEEVLLVGLRTKDGISKKMWKKRFGIDFDRQFASQLDQLESMETQLLHNDALSICLTTDGLMLSDSIIKVLLRAIEVPLDS